MTYYHKLNAAINFGLIVDVIEEDEAIHRVATQAKPKSKNGWYASYTDALVMGDWATGVVEVWKPEGSKRSYGDKQKIKAAIERDNQHRREQQETAAHEARRLFSQGRAVSSHPYLIIKGLTLHDGLRQSGNWLLVPLYDLQSKTIMNLQRIAHDGTKLFLKGGLVSGLASPVGFNQQPETIYICEGYATAVTLHQITREPTLAAMNANNLLSVARLVKEKWPNATIIIAGDDDAQTEQQLGINPGVKKASEAAAAIGAKVSFPPFTPEQKKAGLTDWNDFYLNKKAVA